MTLEKLNEKDGSIREFIKRSEEENLFESYDQKMKISEKMCSNFDTDSSWPDDPNDLERWDVEKWLDELRDWE